MKTAKNYENETSNTLRFGKLCQIFWPLLVELEVRKTAKAEVMHKKKQ